jgi:hypothetical protein
MKPHFGYIHKPHTSSMNVNVASLIFSGKLYALQYFGIFEFVLNV